MKLRKPDSSIKRVGIAILVAAAVMGLVGWAFFLAGSTSPGEKVNGMRIVAAAQAFTRTLRAARQPVPPSIRVEELVAHGFLKTEDVAAFRGLEATILLTSADAGPQTVLMRVHFPDGTDMMLLADGSVQTAAR